jgi:flavin reductase (DIM6/NTAB) family NADH-FMN oxidoreductase RutF
MGFLDIFRRHPNTVNEAFVYSPMRDNWYQASSYYPSPFALITTVAEDGNTNIGPYQLTFPFEVINGRSFMLCSRQNSNTDLHLKRTQVCALNYVEFDKKKLKNIVDMGYPGQSTEEKMKDNPYTLIDSPTPGREADGVKFPKIIKEAFQVYECVVDVQQPVRDDGITPEYFVLRIEKILMKETWQKNLENGATQLPNIPLAYGFRDGGKFWFAEHKKPFWFPIPTNKGPKEESVLYEANRLDPDNVQFTREACKQLTGIPKPFVKAALKGIIKQAKEDGVSLVDVDYVKKINEERNG